jgi:hypothetical protein
MREKIKEVEFQLEDTEDLQKEDFTVAEMLEPFKDNEKDLLEEECVALFGEPKGSKNTEEVKVPLAKFQNWWQEGTLDHFENIKFYLIQQITKLVQDNVKEFKIPNVESKKVHTDRFQSYVDKRKEMDDKLLKEHYETNFAITFLRPHRGNTDSKKRQTGKKGAKEAIAALIPKTEETKSASMPIRPNTTIDIDLTFFPNMSEDTINYLQSLHMFQERKSWISIGFKSKAKDLKSVIEDLNQMEYLKTIQEELHPTIALDGMKVRLGFESKSFDPFEDMLKTQAEELD